MASPWERGSLTAGEESVSPSSHLKSGWEWVGLEGASQVYPDLGEAIAGEFVNEDVPWI